MTDGKLKDDLICAVHRLRNCTRLDQPNVFETRRLDVQRIVKQLEQREPDREDEDRDMISDAQQSFETLRAEIDKEDARYRDELKKASDERRIDYARRMHRIWHQLEQPEASGEAEVEPSLQAAFNQIEANGEILNDVCIKAQANVTQLAELTKTANANHGKIISLTNGVNAHERQFAELAKRMNGYDQQLAALDDAITPPPKPEPACEHPVDRRLPCSNRLKGVNFTLCLKCGGMLYDGIDEWSLRDALAGGRSRVRFQEEQPIAVEVLTPQPPSEKAEGGETEKGANDEE